MRDVAFVGTMGSGKTTAADLLCGLFGARRVSVATELKRLAVELYDMEGKNRELLQRLGSALRGVDPDVFVRCLHRELRQLKSRDPDACAFVVDDVRFENELDYLRDNGFLMVYISRNVPAEHMPTGTHESETGALALARKCDAHVVNDGCLSALRELVRDLGSRS